MRIMVVSREMATLRPLWSVIELNSWQLEAVTTGWEALERVQSGVSPHLLVLDAAKGDTDCLHILQWLRRLRPELPILFLCHPEEASKKDDAIRMGADHVLVKPCVDQELEFAICNYLGGSRRRTEQPAGGDNAQPLGEDGYFVCASALMRKVASQAELLAEVDVPVLILGEAGSGKEAVARLIHRLSVRSGFKFLKVNCAGMPGDLLEKEIFGTNPTGANERSAPGKLEIADKGIVLIAEVTAMPNRVQAALLNVLSTSRYARVGSDRNMTSHARILISSSAQVEHALADKLIREDLYQRASAFTVHVPPLRQRKEEIPLLLGHFMHKLAKHYGLPKREIPAAVIDQSQNYSWPGNLDELETFVKRYIVSGDSILAQNQVHAHQEDTGRAMLSSAHETKDSHTTGDASTNSTSLKSLIQTLKSETEQTAIGLALERTHWNRRAAARLLSVSYRTLLYKIEQYHMRAIESVGPTSENLHSEISDPGAKPKASRLPCDKN